MTARDLFTEDTNTHREGHGVLKGEKPTPSASTERPDPTFSRARICCSDCGRGTVNAPGFVRCDIGPAWQMASPTTACRLGEGIAVPLTPKQLSKRAAQAGIDQAVEHAERVRPGWSTDALGFIRTFAVGRKGTRLTGYELVQWSVRAGFEQPPTPQGWGGPLQRAARTGLLIKVGSVPDPNPARHGSDVPLWEVA